MPIDTQEALDEDIQPDQESPPDEQQDNGQDPFQAFREGFNKFGRQKAAASRQQDDDNDDQTQNLRRPNKLVQRTLGKSRQGVKLAGRASKQGAKITARAANAATQAATKVAVRVAVVALANPYVWIAIGIVLFILLIVLLILFVISPGQGSSPVGGIGGSIPISGAGRFKPDTCSDAVNDAIVGAAKRWNLPRWFYYAIVMRESFCIPIAINTTDRSANTPWYGAGLTQLTTIKNKGMPYPMDLKNCDNNNQGWTNDMGINIFGPWIEMCNVTVLTDPFNPTQNLDRFSSGYAVPWFLYLKNKFPQEDNVTLLDRVAFYWCNGLPYRVDNYPNNDGCNYLTIYRQYVDMYKPPVEAEDGVWNGQPTLIDYSAGPLPQAGIPNPSSAYIPPSTNDCGKYASLLTSNRLLPQNFGDPNCDFTKQSVDDLFRQLDPTNADWWFQQVTCQSAYNPNAWRDPNILPQTPDPAGKWGLLQLGSSNPAGQPPPAPGRGGEYDRGDVNWQMQVRNAVQLKQTSGAYAPCP